MDNQGTPENPVVSINLNGREFRLRYGQRAKFRINALGEQYEQATGFAQACMMVYALLDQPNPKMTPEDIADLISDDDLPKIGEAVTKAMELANPDVKKKSSASGPSS